MSSQQFLCLGWSSTFVTIYLKRWIQAIKISNAWHCRSPLAYFSPPQQSSTSFCIRLVQSSYLNHSPFVKIRLTHKMTEQLVSQWADVAYITWHPICGHHISHGSYKKETIGSSKEICTCWNCLAENPWQLFEISPFHTTLIPL
jgi:hypothetical protein